MPQRKQKQNTYRVSFRNDEKIYEIFATSVVASDLYGFIEISGLIFGSKSTVVVDPAEERLASEFAGVECTHIPMHAIVRVDEVEEAGTPKVHEDPGGRSKVVPFLMPVSKPGKSRD